MTFKSNILRAAKSALGAAADSSNDNSAPSLPPTPLSWPASFNERDELVGQHKARVNAEAAPRIAAIEAQLREVELELSRARQDWNVALGKIDEACAAARSEHTAAIRAESDAAITPLAKAWCTEPSRATALALIELLPTLGQRVFDVTYYGGNDIVGPCVARAFAAAIGIEPSDVAHVATQGEGLAKQVLPLANRKDVTAFERLLRELESALRAVDADNREQRGWGGRVTKAGHMHAR
jgi:hypothetical protein